jgi:hypothetical protein
MRRIGVLTSGGDASVVKSKFQPRSPLAIFKAAALYFAIVFGTGFVLGTVRVLWAVPRFGERVAELMEQPLMLVATILAARWIVRGSGIASMSLKCLGMGLIALGLLVTSELIFVLRLRGLSLSEYIEGRDPVLGTVYLLMLGVFALMPWLVAKIEGNAGLASSDRSQKP